MVMIVSTEAVNMDEELLATPEEFRSEYIGDIKCIFMPFSDGPRSCIALTIPTTKGVDNDNNKLASEDVKIDVFIDRLLKSNNFDRLVETIAEKIAQRIGHCDKVKQRVELKETGQDPIKRRAHKRKDAEENTSVTENKLMLKYKLFTKNFDSDSRRSGSESRHRGLLLDFN